MIVTAAAAERARALLSLTAALPGPPLAPLDSARPAVLRAEAGRADIDIGE